MRQENLISIEELIKAAKSKGINFGKANPYNRLRYYTKISLLPHMERRQQNKKIEAYYPKVALEKLIKIENLKAKGLPNEEIIEKLKKEEASLKKVILKNITKQNLVIGAIFLSLVIVTLHQKGIISLNKESTTKFPNPRNVSDLRIIDSGTATMRGGRKKTFVKSEKVTDLSQIQIAFKNSYSPATTYFIEIKLPGEGFVLNLDNQTAEDTEFTWWVVEN